MKSELESAEIIHKPEEEEPIKDHRKVEAGLEIAVIFLQSLPLALLWVDQILTKKFVNKREHSIYDDHQQPRMVPDDLTPKQNNDGEEVVRSTIHEKPLLPETVYFFAGKGCFNSSNKWPHYILLNNILEYATSL